MSSTPANANAPIARTEAISKYYGKGDTRVTALGSVSVEFRTGEFTAIMGPSGSGKSTLMHCMAGLDSVSEGSTFVGDTDLSTLNDKQLTRLRRDRIGFVFQSFNLVPTLTASENITLPMDIGGHRVDKEWFTHIVTSFGLTERLDHRPSELSGGQQQRVACARAIIGRPDIIFGDEPTGNLDSNSSTEVLTTLRSVVTVTHDPRAASYADRVIFLTDGHIVDELTDPTTEAILTTMATIDNPDNQAS